MAGGFEIKSMNELVELEETAAREELEQLEKEKEEQRKKPLTEKEMAMRSDATAKVVISDDYLEANMCVFAPQYGGKEITLEAMYAALKDEHVAYGIDEDALEAIYEGRMYDKVFTVARGYPPEDGVDGKIINHYDTKKNLVPKTLEDGSVDFHDLGLVVNIKENDIISEITLATPGTPGKNVYGADIPPIPGKNATIPMGNNTAVSNSGTVLYATAAGNLVYSGGKFNVEPAITISEDVGSTTGNINFSGDVIVRGGVMEGFSVNAGKTLTVNGLVSGATLHAQGDIVVKGGVFASTIISENGNITIGFGENDTIETRGNLTSTSLIGCKIKIEGDLEVIRNPGCVIGGDVSVMGNFDVVQLGHKNYISTVISVGSMTNLVMEKVALEKECKAIDDYIEKLAASIEFLQEKKRSGVNIGHDKEEYITNAIRLKVQKGIEKKPLRKRIEEIDHIISTREDLSLNVRRCIYPNVRINLNSFSTTTSKEYGKCKVVCGKNDIEFK